MNELTKLGAAAKEASRYLAICNTYAKNQALEAIAAALKAQSQAILKANEQDINRAQESGMAKAMLDRLTLNQARIDGMSKGLLEVAALPDPIGETIDTVLRPNGLSISRRRTPLGVIGIIFESRPNVTVDAAALCLKSGNAVILRGGKEAISSNTALAKIMRQALKDAGLPEDAVCLVEDTTRQSAVDMMGLTGYIDLLIPRGGAGLIRTVVENAKVPVVETGVGNCHIYVDDEANLQMGAKIIFNAKCSRPSVCNAAETLLVARSIAQDFLPLAKELLDTKQVELRGCPETAAIIGESIVPATEEDYYTEFLDYILAVKVVSGIDEAMAHIAKYTSGHSEAIITNNYFTARRFQDQVDAAAVYVNASTRFTDGGEFGLGAEIGISTQKTHARGPLGLRELTSFKFIINGEGQIR